nr:hypothetical protein [Tanacetum cinerariifolium]
MKTQSDLCSGTIDVSIFEILSDVYEVCNVQDLVGVWIVYIKLIFVALRNFKICRAAGEHNCGSNGWSKSCGQGQAFLSVQAAAMPEDHQQKTVAMKQKNYLFDELQNASIKLDDVKDDSISR